MSGRWQRCLAVPLASVPSNARHLVTGAQVSVAHVQVGRGLRGGGRHICHLTDQVINGML